MHHTAPSLCIQCSSRRLSGSLCRCVGARVATMAQTLKTLLVAACLVSLRPVLAASEEDKDGAVAVAEPRYVTHNEKGGYSGCPWRGSGSVLGSAVFIQTV